MSQIEKLKALSAQNRRQGAGSMQRFDELVCIHLDVPPKPYYPKLRDDDGNKVKDDRGRDKRSETQSGWLYTFSQFNTAKVVKVVLPTQKRIEPLQAIVVGGMGYDIAQANMIFIEKDSVIKSFT